MQSKFLNYTSFSKLKSTSSTDKKLFVTVERKGKCINSSTRDVSVPKLLQQLYCQGQALAVFRVNNHDTRKIPTKLLCNCSSIGTKDCQF